MAKRLMTEAVHRLLLAPRDDKREMHRLKGERSSVECGLMPSAIRYDLDKVQTSPSDPMINGYARLEKIDRELVRMYAIRQKHIEEIRMVTAEYLTPLEKTVIDSWYTYENMDYHKIGRAIGYEKSEVYRIRIRAIKKLNEVIK